MPTKRDVELWLIDKTTVDFFKRVDELKKLSEEHITDGSILSDPQFAFKYSKLLGVIEAYRNLEDRELMFNITEVEDGD